MEKLAAEVKELKAYYKVKGKLLKAVDGVSLELHDGEILGIAGESGCGKSTLAMSLSGLFLYPLKCYGGSIKLGDVDVLKMDVSSLRKSILGKKISFIPQSAMNALNPTLKIKNFVIDVLKEHDFELSKEEIMRRVEKRFDSLSLSKMVINSYPFELSGGMKQRVITVISTLMDPEILIADEPTSALDVSSQHQIVKLIKTLLEQRIVKSVVFITHELPLLRHIADRIAIMYAGQIVEKGTTSQIIFSPFHPYTEMLMSSIITPEKGMKGRKLPFVSGSPPSLYEIAPGCRFAERCPYATEECKNSNVEFRKIGDREVRCIHPLTERNEGNAIK